MKFFISLAALVSLVSAITVETPSGWTSTGPNTVKFTTVSTDASSFAVVLVNQNTTLLSSSRLLKSDATSSVTSFDVSADCNNPYPVGSGFVLNFVQNSSATNSILAQSQSFNISKSTTSCSSSSASASSTQSKSAAASASSAAASASSTKSGALSTFGLSSGTVALGSVVGLVAAVGALI